MIKIANTIIKKDGSNIEQIKDLFSDDADLTGENGEEYTSSEAIQTGFTCDLDYFLHKAIKEAGNDIYGVICRFLSSVSQKNKNYYMESEYDISEYDDNYLIAFAYVIE